LDAARELGGEKAKGLFERPLDLRNNAGAFGRIRPPGRRLVSQSGRP
jgi:hypothetical protein